MSDCLHIQISRHPVFRTGWDMRIGDITGTIGLTTPSDDGWADVLDEIHTQMLALGPRGTHDLPLGETGRTERATELPTEREEVEKDGWSLVKTADAVMKAAEKMERCAVEMEKTWLLYEMPKSRRLVIVDCPFKSLKPYGLEYVGQFDSLADCCEVSERLKIEYEDDEDEPCWWSIEVLS